MSLLANLNVLNCGTGIAAGYCTKLLTDLGATVVNVEPVDGDPLRRWSASHTPKRDGLLYQFLHAGQRSVVGSVARPEVEHLLRDADVVVETGEQHLDVAALQERFPLLSVVSITPFGRTGPWSPHPATEFTLQAWSGSLAVRGSPDREPLQVGGRVGEWIGGSYAAIAALAAVRQARVSGRGDPAVIPLFEGMAAWRHG